MVSITLNDDEVVMEILSYLKNNKITNASESEAAGRICNNLKEALPKKYHGYDILLSRGRTKRLLDNLVRDKKIGKTKDGKYWLILKNER